MERMRTALKWCLWPAALAGMILIAGNPASGQDDGDGAAGEAGLQELTRGPIHEGFAEPVNFNPKPGLIVKKEPPKPIEELPPDQKPEGDNVAFIAGYFTYDEDKDDFFYTSGIWRLIPPGKEWVGGYWHRLDDGWQWVSGYWKAVEAGAPDATKSKVEYYPEPPPSLENGANTQPPTVDHSWVPGCHVWYTNRYVWRGGYWIQPTAGWVWVPSHYVWTPCGYVFVAGYHDLEPVSRGVMFAPCYIDPVVYLRPSYVYCPRLVIDTNACFGHLFVHSSYNHYCYGDYYHDRYLSIGISPWFRFHYSSGHHCPIYSHYRWTHARHDTRWEIGLRDNYRHCHQHVEYRPARTYVQQKTVINNITVNKNVNVTNVHVQNLAMAKPLNQVAKNQGVGKDQPPIKFQKVTQDDRKVLALKAADARKESTERLNLEGKVAKDLKIQGSKPGADGKIAPKEAKPLTLDMPKSAVSSKAVDKISAKNTPPPAPKDNIKVPRVTPGSDKPIVGGGDKPVIGSGSKTGDKGTPIINRPGSDKPITGGTTKPGGDKPIGSGKADEIKGPPIINRPGGDKPIGSGKAGEIKSPPIINRPGGDKPIGSGKAGEIKSPPIINRPGGDKPIDSGKAGEIKSPPIINRPGGDKPPTGGSGKPPTGEFKSQPPTGGGVTRGSPPPPPPPSGDAGAKFSPPPPTGGGSGGKPPAASGGSGKPPASSGSGKPPASGSNKGSDKPKKP